MYQQRNQKLIVTSNKPKTTGHAENAQLIRGQQKKTDQNTTKTQIHRLCAESAPLLRCHKKKLTKTQKKNHIPCRECSPSSLPPKTPHKKPQKTNSQAVQRVLCSPSKLPPKKPHKKNQKKKTHSPCRECSPSTLQANPEEGERVKGGGGFTFLGKVAHYSLMLQKNVLLCALQCVLQCVAMCCSVRILTSAKRHSTH